MISFEEIIDRVHAGEYTNTKKRPMKPEGYGREGYVYDEEQSVKWNREHRIELENNWKEEWKLYMAAGSEKQLEFRKDLVKVIMTYADLTESQAEVIYKKAYENEHDGGIEEVINEAKELSEFITEVISAI